MATLNDILNPSAIDLLKPLGERLGAIRAELESGVVVINTGYGPLVELGRGATVKQAVEDVMKNARKHAERQGR